MHFNNFVWLLDSSSSLSTSLNINNSEIVNSSLFICPPIDEPEASTLLELAFDLATLEADEHIVDTWEAMLDESAKEEGLCLTNEAEANVSEPKESEPYESEAKRRAEVDNLDELAFDDDAAWDEAGARSSESEAKRGAEAFISFF